MHETIDEEKGMNNIKDIQDSSDKRKKTKQFQQR